MKLKKSWKAEDILTLAVSVFLVIMFLLNIHLLYEPAKKFLTGVSGFETFITDVQYVYTNDIAWKSPFINLSGLFARLTGRKICNDTLLLNNGTLTDQQPTIQDVYPLSRELGRFNEYLSLKNIPFLFVQAPYKVDTESSLLPEGVCHYANFSADLLVDGLEQQGINVMDLRAYFSQNAQQVEENFFRTDHHWNFTAALRAVPMLAERMDTLLPDRELDASRAAFDQWEAHTLEDWFLGSWGKRTGILYGGVDDLTYYTPKFSTQISCAVLNHVSLTSGDFVQANMDMAYTQRRDYFNDSPYCIYVGGDYPLVEHRSLDAPNQLKVLLIKDSFALPIQCFFSTLFSEVNVIDPRYMSDSADTVMEYVNNTNPDIVIMLISPLSLDHQNYTNLGIDSEWARESAMTWTQTVLFQGNVSLADGAEGDDYYFVDLPVALEPGKRYTLRFDDVLFHDGSKESNGVEAALYDQDEDVRLKDCIFDIEYERQTDGFSWTFNTPKNHTDRLQVLLYAGMPEHTDSVRLTYVNVTLTLEE